MRSRHIALLVAGLLAVGLLAYRFVFGLELMGYDTYPLILAARIETWSDFLGTFTEKLMDGQYPDGLFWRPVTNLSFAVDEALYGLRAAGYHATDVGLLILNAALTGWVASRLFGRSLVTASVAALVFLLHPIQLEVVPVPARRADALAIAFLLGSLLLQPGASQRLFSGRTVLGALCAAAALGSKETGIIAGPLLFLWLLLGPPAASLRRALQACLLPAAAVLLLFGARFLVLGELGGHASTSPAGALLYFSRLAPHYARWLLVPQPPGSPDLLAVSLGALALAAIALAIRATERTRRGACVRGLLFVLLWCLGTLCLAGMSGRYEAWYAVLLLVPYASTLGFVADQARHALSRRAWLPAAVATLCVAALGASHLRYSALLQDYPQWRGASEAVRLFFDEFDREVRRTAPGKGLVMSAPTKVVPPVEGGPEIDSVWPLASYSVQAYARLALPDLEIRVRKWTGDDLGTPAPGVISVVVKQVEVTADS